MKIFSNFQTKLTLFQLLMIFVIIVSGIIITVGTGMILGHIYSTNTLQYNLPSGATKLTQLDHRWYSYCYEGTLIMCTDDGSNNVAIKDTNNRCTGYIPLRGGTDRE